MPSIDFDNATEYSIVHGGSLSLPQQSSSSPSARYSSSTSSSKSNSNPPSPTSPSSSSSSDNDPASPTSPTSDLKPVILKSCRHSDDFADLLYAYSKLRDFPQAANIVVFYGATREYPSASSLAAVPIQGNEPTKNSTTSTLGSIAASIVSLSFSSSPSSSSTAKATTTTTTSANSTAAAMQQDCMSPRDWLLTKPAGMGTLYEYLKSPQGVDLDWLGRIRLMRGVVNGLLHLHDHGLLHMNLHSDNVLVEAGPVAVLTDFGQVSRSTRGPEPAPDSNPTTTTTTTTTAQTQKSSARWVHSGGVYEKGLAYTAPERLANPTNPCTTASDIYSLGVIMLEILTGHRSVANQFLASISSTENHIRLAEGSTSTDGPSTSLPTISTPHGSLAVPRALESLIRRICSRDPAQRPGLLVIRSQLKAMANTSFDLHVREPISKNTTGIQLNVKKPLSVISVVTTPSVIAESASKTPEPGALSARSLMESSAPNLKKRTSILRRALDLSLNSPPASPKRKTVQIWEAVVKGDLKTIHSLLSQGVSVNQRHPVTDHTPLIAAVADLENPNQVPNISVLELLINRGAEINAFDQKTKQTILHHMCARPNPSPAVLRFLLERGANPNAVSSARQTPLHTLAEKAKTSPLEPMRLLLDFGADVDAKGPVMWTPLHLLCSSEKPFLDAIMLLLTRDVDVNIRDSNQWTALHFAAHYNQEPTQALKILVDAGADVNALTKRHETVVHILLKSKGIDRLSTIDLAPSVHDIPGVNGAAAAGAGAAASTGSIASGLLGQFGGNRKRISVSGGANGGVGVVGGGPFAGPGLSRFSTVVESDETETGLSDDPLISADDIVLSPVEEAKEESLKKLADLMKWLVVDCGVRLEPSTTFEDPYPPIHPKNQHILYRAIRLGMRPIVAALLETSLVMSETYILDDGLQLTEEMINVVNAGMVQIQLQSSCGISETGTVRSSVESSRSGHHYVTHHRRNSSVSSSTSSVMTGMSGGLSNASHTTASSIASIGSSNTVTPRSLAISTAAISRIQEIEVLLKVWRFGDQRQQLLDSNSRPHDWEVVI
ncbi:MAG: hypothetical protein J3Q66DRAFT_367223 [Benniella sp.]|nr:MAG: hypothetical protein J3Q66DRAFT_367223 [Benniella sp.]